MINFGEHFINKKNPDLNKSADVEHEANRLKIKAIKDNDLDQSGQVKPKDNPETRLANFFEILKRTHEGHSKDPLVFERIRKYYHNKYIIKPEDIEDSVFMLESRIARELGYSYVEITDEYKKRKIQEIIEDQKHSLDLWLNYLSSNDAMYPMWAKYFAFTSLLGMGKFEKKVDEKTGKETGIFQRRTRKTISPFPPFNAGALAQTIEAIVDKAKYNITNKTKRILLNKSIKLSDEDYLKLISTENFSSIYAQFLIEVPEYSKEGLENTDGKWVKYLKGSNPDELVKSLEGHPLEWCTRNKETARNQLKGGDFYVYYSNDKDGNPKIPRVAIRMSGNEIAEVRGIAGSQHLDPYITPVVEGKMKEFPDGEKYKKKSQDMKKLTEIEKKINRNIDLNKNELEFLYEINNKIEGFGYDRDPRIQEIIENRDLKKDLAFITGFKEEEIGINQEEALSGNIKYYRGSLNLNNLETAEGLVLPSSFNGSLYLRGLRTAEGLVLPNPFNGDLYLSGLKIAEKATLKSRYPNINII